jgi:orotate phosphoribosyltransferase
MQNYTLIQLLHQIGAIQFGEFILKSGQSSKIYLDLRKIISYPYLLQKVAQAISKKIKVISYDLICGVPYTALPIATCLSIQKDIPMVLRRKEKKTYGTKQQIEGVFQPGQSCLIVEDIITTGSSILETADDLNSAGLIVTNAVVFINREQDGEINLIRNNISLHSVFKLTDILQSLITFPTISSQERDIILELQDASC